jgi:hypothetical protein
MTDVSSLASWGSQAAGPVRQRSWSLAQSSPCTAHSTTESDSAIGFEDGLEITVGNADDWLYYNSQYRVLVCRYHEYAVWNLASHLRLQHKVRSSERSAIEEMFSTCELLEPAQVATPLPLEAPFHWLGAPCEDFSATNPDAARSQRVVTRSGNIVIKNTRGSRMSTTRNTGTCVRTDDVSVESTSTILRRRLSR